MRLVVLCLALTLNAAGDRVDDGKTALASGRYKDAVRLLEQGPDSSRPCEASFYLGLARYRLKQLDRAIVELQVARHCDPASADILIAMAAVYADKGDDDRAVAAFDSALQLKPNHVEALRAAASLDLRHERNERAIVRLEKLVAIEQEDAQAHADLAAAYAGTGNLSKARGQFQEALKLHPGNASALMGLGNADIKMGQTDEAISLLKKAAKADPLAYAPRFLLASAYNSQSRFAEALAECNEALRLGAVDPEVYYHLARAYRGLGREDDARKALALFSTLRLQSKDAVEAKREAARLIGQAKPLVDEGKLPDAISLLERASGLDPKNPQVAFRLAGLYYDTRQYEAARQFARRAVAIAPAEWLYHYLLGLIENASGRLDPAHDSFETAVRLNPSAADAFNQLGNIAMSRQDFVEAKQNFEKASLLDPRETTYQVNRDAAKLRLANK
ncbi:MAG: tetratricopeptide repeat protein [Acidobacteriota bacterium]|nr:tetratricopeptide repeat protein [Acidobacteriota bacterium]